MTPQEAIDFFESFLKLIPANPYKEAAECSIAALKKQIPKKPLNPCGRYWGHAKGGNCPICGSHTNSSTYNYCRKCGQALDWGDGE